MSTQQTTTRIDAAVEVATPLKPEGTADEQGDNSIKPASSSTKKKDKKKKDKKKKDKKRKKKRSKDKDRYKEVGAEDPGSEEVGLNPSLDERRISKRVEISGRVSYKDLGSDVDDINDESKDETSRLKQMSTDSDVEVAGEDEAVPEPTLKTKVEMLWPDDGIYYGATVIEYNSTTKKHCVLYVADSTSEWIDFNDNGPEKVIWRMCADQKTPFVYKTVLPPESADSVLSQTMLQPKAKKQKHNPNKKRKGDKKQKKELPLVAEPTSIVEKIMGKKEESANEGEAAITLYYVKWKGWSYIHCSWEEADQLFLCDPHVKGKIKRFEIAQLTADSYMQADMVDSYFNPDFCEVHRVISVDQDAPPRVDTPGQQSVHTVARAKSSTGDGGGSTSAGDSAASSKSYVSKFKGKYLVKWCALPYSECTWEWGSDIQNDQLIQEFQDYNKLPPSADLKPKPHPPVQKYVKLTESPGFGVDATLLLREYQLEGVNWLMWNWFNRRPSILADEMGLGKTIQTVALLDQLQKNHLTNVRGPFLIVAPLSLVAQWQSEVELWTGRKMNCIVYHGNNEARQLIRETEFYYDQEQTGRRGGRAGEKITKFHCLVTTFEIAIKDIRVFTKIHWRCLIVDEAHRLKNQASRLNENLRSIKRDHCVLLTGTPLQNKTEELWALLNFLSPSSFPKLQRFLELFGDLKEASQVAQLHNLLKPFLLRRVKEDVEKSLPPKEETIIEVELTSVQKQFYRAIYEKNTTFLFRGAKPANTPSLMNVVMELRKCCNHPYLNRGVEELLTGECKTQQELQEVLVNSSGKIVLLDKLFPRLHEDKHQVLLFSQMVRVLDLMEEYVRYKGYKYERLDGSVRGNLRQAAIDRFVKPEYNRFIMLLSTRAGGLGLNLTAADTVIIFDSDWNPQNDLQAQARAHRIGQTQAVKVYRLLTRKTYEMHMFHRASMKLGLDRAVLSHAKAEREKGEDADGTLAKAGRIPNAKEIDELLKRGAYDVFREDDTDANQFMQADIDSILQRSSHVIQYEQNQARSSFSKASFVSADDQNAQVDIDDPNFWEKAVGLEAEDEAEAALAEWEELGQRKRKRVQRFGERPPGADDLDDELDDLDMDQGTGQEKDEKEWTGNGRDRFQRALLQCGFGRWSMIRKHANAAARSLQSLEDFGRLYVMQYGLCVAKGNAKRSKPETNDFVNQTVEAAAQAVQDGVALPAVLQQTEFVNKLVAGGARRALQRLDHLHRLGALVSAAAMKVRGQKGMEMPEGWSESGDVMAFADVLCDGIPGTEIAQALELVSHRPPWSKLCAWWNETADRHLVYGVFKHGYGRYPLIKEDTELCFFERDQEAHETLTQALKKREEMLANTAGSDTKPQPSTGTGSSQKATEHVSKGTQQPMAVVQTLPTKSPDRAIAKSVATPSAHEAEPATSSNPALPKAESGNHAEKVGDLKSKQGAEVGADASMDNYMNLRMPEIQTMNKLLIWLITEEERQKLKKEEDNKRSKILEERQQLLKQHQHAQYLQQAHVQLQRYLEQKSEKKRLKDLELQEQIRSKKRRVTKT